MAQGQAWVRHWGAALIAGAMSLPVLAADPVLSAAASPSPAIEGSTVAIDVLISGISDLYGYQFSLSFDPAVLQATGVTQGAFLPAAGSTFFSGGSIDNTAGKVSFVFDTLVGAIPGASGSGTLARMGFNVVGLGMTPLTFSDVLFLDSSLMDIVVQAPAGSLMAVPVPEPGTWALFGLGLAALAGRRLNANA